MSMRPLYAPGPIWPPDWSQFIPDAIGAIITGAIIGVVLWRIESRANSVRKRREAEARWRVARAPLRAHLGDHFLSYFGYEPTVDKFVAQWQSFLAVVPPDLASWAEAAPANRELQMASSLVRDLPVLERLTRDMESSLRMVLQVALLAFPDIDRESLDIDEGLHFCMARILTSDGDLTDHTHDWWRVLPGMHEIWGRPLEMIFEASPEFRERLERITQLRVAVTKRWKALQDSLDS
jgi:hypothetical protein